MENSNTDSEALFLFQNQNQSHKFPPSSHSAFYGSSSMTNTIEEDVCESYKKRKLTPIQLRLLEESFKAEKTLEADRKLCLAQKLGMEPNQVAVWFQNRRARFKTKQLEHDCESLKASYAKLKTDWDILFLQNEILKNKVAFLIEKLITQEDLETQSMEVKKLGEEGSENKQYIKEEGLGNQYSFPELAVLGFYYDPILTSSNLRL